jgi:hypothetical protein
MRPGRKEIEEQDGYLRGCQEEFCLAAEYVANALSHIPEVQKVVLFGSVSGPLEKEVPRLHNYRRFGIEIDLAVCLSNLDRLKAIQKAYETVIAEIGRCSLHRTCQPVFG